MSLYLDIKVIPKSSRSRHAYESGHKRLKVYATSAPEKGRANKEVVAYLARILDLPKKSVIIVAGETSQMKRVFIDTERDEAEVHAALGIAEQLTLW